MNRKVRIATDPSTSKQNDDNDNSPKQLKKSSKLKRKMKVLWMTRLIAEDFGREYVLATTFQEMIIYIIFVIFVTLAIIGRHTVSKFYLTQTINDHLVEREFVTNNDISIKFDDIRSVADFWHYTETLMINTLYNEDTLKILNENLLLGVPRIRQVKVRDDSCVIHEYFRRLFLKCYNYFNEKYEDRNSFGLKTAPAWVYTPSDKTGSLSFRSRIGSYTGGGFYVDLTRDKQKSLDILKQLKDNLWITQGTRVIFIDFTIYNANLNLFCICNFIPYLFLKECARLMGDSVFRLIFELPPTGGVLPSTSFNTLKLVRLTIWDKFVLICEFIVYLFGCYYLLQQIREFIYFKLRYFLIFFIYIDTTILILCGLCFIYRIIILKDIGEYLKNLNQDKYLNLESICLNQVTFNTMLAILLFMVYIKIFKYLNFNKTMGQLNNTLTRCALDILGFSIMFFIIFLAYAELGYLLFGTKVESFSSFGISMFTLLRTILGDFDYNAIENANRYLAPVYFLSYIFLVFFVLLNMFLAIINDTYTDVKTEISIAPNELQMIDFIKMKLYNCFQKLGCKLNCLKPKIDIETKTTLQEIRDILKKYGFNDVEIEMFFTRYNIDPNANLNQQDILKKIEEMDGGKIAKNKDEYVKIDDFLAQQERLDRIERLIEELGKKIDQLLKQLQRLESIQVNKRG